MSQEKLTAPTTYGFFGLNELHTFFREKISSYYIANDDINVVLDFSNVIYWDISALLWMVVALDHFQKMSSIDGKKFEFQLLLSQPSKSVNNTEDMTERDKGLLKGADYLRRWKFFDALRNLNDDPSIYFIDEQKSYIDCDPIKYFRKGDPGACAGPG